MATCVQAWVEELKHTQELVQARPNLCETLCNILEEKLQRLAKPTAKVLLDLYSALEASSLPQNHVKALQSKVDQWSKEPDMALRVQLMPQQLDGLTN